ncbi:hypothetical protein B0I31_10214 [Saccharothrix carnea]|uniref:Uncharacterized protein n=1 Tax=Saccharothrix carnea TaxID=1280637 RepID=A0A2P8IF03_SACCR|nr:hypothetical protein [Saccharothrix carnea]PSL57037.1 hypothetical protein B0I31_10214 [Saccharothrix carnea]
MRVRPTRPGEVRRLPSLRAPAAASRPAGTSVLHAVAVVGSPVALATSLMVYYGWVRTRAKAEKLGYDSALLDFSVQDYLLRSVDVLFVPLTLLVLIALGLHWAHQRVVLPTVRHRRLGTALPRVLTGTALLLGLGLVVLTVLRPHIAGTWFPYVLTLALVSALYADVLRRHVGHSRVMAPSLRVLALLALGLTVFWDTERIATAVGEGQANNIAADPDQLVAVTVHSAKRLATNLPGVVETPVTSPGAHAKFRYDGLRLVQRSGNRYFLVGTGWDPAHRRVMLLKETDDLHLEFSR